MYTTGLQFHPGAVRSQPTAACSMSCSASVGVAMRAAPPAIAGIAEMIGGSRGLGQKFGPGLPSCLPVYLSTYYTVPTTTTTTILRLEPQGIMDDGFLACLA